MDIFLTKQTHNFFYRVEVENLVVVVIAFEYNAQFLATLERLLNNMSLWAKYLSIKCFKYVPPEHINSELF